MIFGGRDNNGVVVNTVQGYNPVTNATVDFTATDPYPELTSPGGVEVVGNKAYSFGGFDAVVTTAGCMYLILMLPMAHDGRVVQILIYPARILVLLLLMA